MRIEVDPEALVAAGRQMASLGSQLGRLSDALGAALSGGIASGTDPAGLNFGMKYGRQAQDFAEAVADPDKTHDLPEVLAEGSWSGMQTFDQHLLALVQDGTVDVRTATMAASNPHDFGVMLRRTGWTPAGAVADDGAR